MFGGGGNRSTSVRGPTRGRAGCGMTCVHGRRGGNRSIAQGPGGRGFARIRDAWGDFAVRVCPGVGEEHGVLRCPAVCVWGGGGGFDGVAMRPAAEVMVTKGTLMASKSLRYVVLLINIRKACSICIDESEFLVLHYCIWVR